MKQLRQLLLALSTLLILVPFRFAEAQEQLSTEMGRTYTPSKQVEPLRVGFSAVQTASLSVVHLSNPCFSGCGYEYHSCTWWVAFWREQAGLPVPNNLHDAKFWAVNASAQGIEIVGTPQVNEIAVDTAGQWGHVMLVRAVYPDGSFLVSEGNYDFGGSTRERVVHSPFGLTFVYF